MLIYELLGVWLGDLLNCLKQLIMPELPDLQVFSRNLNKALIGKKLKKVNVPVTRKLKVSVAALRKALQDQKVKKIYREGKELHFEFGNGNVLGLHLMLKGNLYLFDGRNTPKHSILTMIFNDDTGLALTDWQKSATPTLNPQPRDTPDALSAHANHKFLKDKLRQTKSSIKNVLLDQKIIRGIGNAYADEILWEAAISPFSIANKIPDNKIKELAKSIKKVLRDAEKQIIKSNPDIITGEVRDFLVIHNAKRKKSPTGAVIQQKMVGSRKTYFTDEQKLFT